MTPFSILPFCCYYDYIYLFFILSATLEWKKWEACVCTADTQDKTTDCLYRWLYYIVGLLYTCTKSRFHIVNRIYIIIRLWRVTKYFSPFLWNFDTVNKKKTTLSQRWRLFFKLLSWTENKALLCCSTSVGVKQEYAPLALRWFKNKTNKRIAEGHRAKQDQSPTWCKTEKQKLSTDARLADFWCRRRKKMAAEVWRGVWKCQSQRLIERRNDRLQDYYRVLWRVKWGTRQVEQCVLVHLLKYSIKSIPNGSGITSSWSCHGYRRAACFAP